MDQWFCKKRKCWDRESKNLDKSRGFNENGMLPVCTKAEYCHRHTEMTKNLLCIIILYRLLHYHASYVDTVDTWSVPISSRIVTSLPHGLPGGRIMEPCSQHCGKIGRGHQAAGKPQGNQQGNRKGVENGFWGLKPYRLMCLGRCFCDWRFQHVFFWGGFHEDNVDWSGWVSHFLAVLPSLNGWQVVCYKHSWGQVQRPKKTCWPFWVSIQVPRSPWRSTAAFFRAWQVRMECNDLF